MEHMVLAFPVLRPMYAEHLDDNYGELLPHLLMADVCRLVLDFQQHPNDQTGALLAWLEQHFEEAGPGGDGVDNVIAASFIEHLPAPGETGRDIVNNLGPTMKRQYDVAFGTHEPGRRTP
ncbi:hypothetical protein [Paenarthrobacter aromaticivorans]|uniref:DUF7674 family protein n=1 Tax=Paenarthrobacter aromaticivorans TaxID=2849150 RepID=UPI003A80C202